jgi:ferric-dicitrate binding protein FerR (iron transport regulator)
MENIPAKYKKLLFNKEADEPLTDHEREAWEEYLIRQKPLTDVNIDDPALKTAMRLHNELEKEKKEAWEKFRVEVLPKYTSPLKTDEVVEVGKKFPIPTRLWMAAAAAVVVAVSGTVLYLYKFNRAAETPPFLIQGSGINEICAITLPDGSQIELNALSYVRYPEKFTNDERHVELTGEAFFTVESDKKHPFRVSAAETDMVATGTAFNVKAYAEEETVTATLQHGELLANDSVIIKEGDQAVIKDGNVQINKKVNMDFVLAWRQKRILLEGETLRSVMQQIKRCYNKNFRIEGNPPVLGMAGTVSATDNSLTDVLRTIETNVPKIKFEFAHDSTIIVTESRK